MAEVDDVAVILTKTIIRHVSPEELPAFPHMVARFLEDTATPPKFYVPPRDREAGDVAQTDIILTYFLFSAILAVLKAIGEGALEAIKDRSKVQVEQWLRDNRSKLKEEAARLAKASEVGDTDKMRRLEAFLDMQSN